ncbi:Hypothetical predicted protein [Mytilus galloprovincialis]|uniref:THAP-type domain-containing protein n=1 Tax=Mytilus galloprovincialis TaxID=29158 RepID=A0A8B6BF97_MYTGA|nr:Hypothetical predicted protein [Mytilus galloprovincialis]
MASPAASTSKQRDEYCCVPFCNGNARTNKELSFHHIPSEKKMLTRKQWIVAIRRDEGEFFKIGGNTVVCSKHFKKEDYRWTPNRKCLKPEAVPSVFDWKLNESSRKAPTSRQSLFKKMKVDDREDEDEMVVEDSVCEVHNSQSVDHENDMSCDSNIHADCLEKIEKLEHVVQQKDSELKDKTYELASLKQKLQMERFGSSEEPSNRGRPKSMDPIDELFMFLCRLRCGFLTEDLSVRFNIHASTVSRKIITWTNYLYFILGGINIWPSRGKIMEHMPQDFKLLYPNTRVIIDCTEIFTERPSSLALASKTFSSYKSHNTWKGLVGISPHGAITFISALYSGCMSDIEITKHSGLIDLLEPGDQIMADKGFILNKLLKDTGVSIATPHFLCSDGQFTPSQIEDNQKIASLRIHVERHIKRAKEYRLLQYTVPLSLAGSVNQLWTVANLLTLFRRPLIKAKKTKSSLIKSWHSVSFIHAYIDII